ncbi:ead/Ea22-like family protein [Burkholderia ambifaria]|uniref:ead/Ea22-like family protein n=1 Tax=Burkholderia ambifaria TaxID=152480 RepID=UPI00158CB2AA|nr:ead/Ea22-like family protein [Burkholderia ambifaria]
MENITSNYDALQAAAENATKGIWINVGAWVENEHDDLKDICDCRPNGNEDYEQARRDAAYIALANPDTILRLLLERRTAIEAAAHAYTMSDTPAIRDVISERRRQIADECRTASQDDTLDECELAAAAACYAIGSRDISTCSNCRPLWPWPAQWWKPSTARANLVKAGALILAEIERLDRATENREERR